MKYRCSEGCEVDPGWSKPPRVCVIHKLPFQYAKPLARASEKTGGKKGGLKRTQRRESKVPRWLTQGFADGVDERHWPPITAGWSGHAYPGAWGGCWLAQFDQEQRPCDHKLERFHFIGRQRVGKVLGDSLAMIEVDGPVDGSWFLHPQADKDLIALAEWDSRNGGIACESHHRRFDSHLTPALSVPAAALPSHVLEFIADWGLETEAERKFGPLTLEREVAA